MEAGGKSGWFAGLQLLQLRPIKQCLYGYVYAESSSEALRHMNRHFWRVDHNRADNLQTPKVGLFDSRRCRG